MIYTTNAIEGFHRQVRKYTKNKGAFASENALFKLLYAAIMQIQKKWNMPLASIVKLLIVIMLADRESNAYDLFEEANRESNKADWLICFVIHPHKLLSKFFVLPL